MNYVKNFNFYGVDAKEIPCITGNGAPTTSTKADVGCFYMNTSNGDVYKCTAVNGNIYTWSEMGAKAPSIVQEPGESETLVMSQKAVTELVANALGGPEITFETVDSVDEMTDTTKQYVLASTGTVWEAKNEDAPAFTNLAVTVKEGYQINGSELAAVPGSTAVEDYIDFVSGDTIRVKGLDLSKGRMTLYGADKAVLDSGVPVPGETYAGVSTSLEGDIYVLVGGTSAKRAYIRIFGALTGEIDDVIVTRNEEITYTEGDTWYDTGLTPAEYNGESFKTVDSVDQMTDTSKQYVLSSTGTLWAYTTKEVYVEHNAYDPNYDGFDKRVKSSGEVVTYAGGLLTDYVEQSYDEECLVTIKGAEEGAEGIKQLEKNYSTYLMVVYYDKEKTMISQVVANQIWGTLLDQPDLWKDDGVLPIVLKPFDITVEADKEKIKSTAFIRIKLGIKASPTTITAADCEGLVINFSTKNTYQEISTWADTGLLPSASGENYVSLLTKINANTDQITELDKRVTAVESGSGTVTVPSFWQTAVDACIARIKSLQVGRNCVTFPFFSDNHQRNGYAGVLIAKVMKECNIPYCFYGGDSISSGYIDSEETMIAQDKAFDTAMSYIPNGRFCRAVGNHDGYWAVDANNKHYYTDAQIYDLFLREESIAQNKHFGGEGTYYYVDDISSKVRWVVLDTNDGTVEAEQISWLRDTALSFSESGWSVVFISHQPISNHYHALISNATDVRTVVTNYMNGAAANKADIIGWFSGHIHRDRIYTGVATNTSDDSEGEAMGFTQVTITSDYTGISYDDATKHAIANDDQSHAIDFVTINKSTKTVHITRLGIGSDREYTYGVE